MEALKLTKGKEVLYVIRNHTSYMFAIEYGWEFEVIEVDEDTVLNPLSDIKEN